MSYEAWWRIPGLKADELLTKPVVAGISRLAEYDPKIRLGDGGIELHFRVPVARVATITGNDPPRDPAQTHYHLTLFVYDAEEDCDYCTMQAYSNEADNRDGWGTLAEIGLKIAEALDGKSEDDYEHDPEEAMGWNSAAVLTRK